MRKYSFIYKTEFKSNIKYISNLLMGSIGYIIHIFIFMNLWIYLYSDSSKLINGYDVNQMIWYIIITEIIWSCVNGRSLCTKVSNDIKSGSIAYNLNKPYNYVGYKLSSHLSVSTIKLFIYTFIGIVLGFAFLKSFPKINIIGIIFVLISIILAIVINSLLSLFTSLFSFIMEDSTPLYWVYSKIILVIGTMFPIEFFPKYLQKILKFSPIYVVCYGPAKLFVDFNYKDSIKILIAQIIYLIISYILCELLYRKGAKKLNVNGG